MRFRTCSALVLLLLLSACATMELSLEEMEDRVLSAGVRERSYHQPVPSSALFIGPGETRWRDEV
jgi:hypothetical protein